MNKPIGAKPFAREIKNHLFFGQTTSLCETCLALVPTKILIEGDLVWFQKRCLEHGVQKTLVSTDAAYYRRCHDYLKPPDKPMQLHNRTEYGCPYDCGLCPDHEQHSCLALLEVNEACNLNCPVCFAESSTARTTHRALDEIERMMDLLVEAEGEPDLLQISGGEPTIHPQILEILRLAKSKPIRHIMLNTNGVRIAKDRDFVKALAAFRPGFEVYLQFDSLKASALQEIRGADLRRIRDQALANLEEAGISTTLVCVVKKGVNDDELGAVIDHALGYACVRGVTFQPIQDAGRNLGFDKNRDRVLLSDIRRGIIEQSPHFTAEDMMPLPCNPDAIAIGYGLRNGRQVTPITRFFDQKTLLDAAPNAITFERNPELKQRLFELMSLSCTGESTEPTLANFLCCLPQFEVPAELGYDKVFRVVIVQFLDRFNFCIASVKRSCIHFVTPEMQMIPFDTYNLFYRNRLVEKFRDGASRERDSRVTHVRS
jgi:uncharacterized radical SAM superfamily Fe-S cluster-containing enzyme